MSIHSEAVSEQRDIQNKLNKTLFYNVSAKQNANNMTFINMESSHIIHFSFFSLLHHRSVLQQCKNSEIHFWYSVKLFLPSEVLN